MKRQQNINAFNVNRTDSQRDVRNGATVSSMGRKKYAAYGSNLDIVQMAMRCPTAHIVGKGMLPNHELLFRGYSESAVATVEPKKGENVPVLIWEIGQVDEDNLDVYEGYPHLYGKQEVTVKTDQGTEKIMVYTMNEGHAIGRPRREYLATITRGYLQAGFDINYLERSLEKCLRMTTKTEAEQTKQFDLREPPAKRKPSEMTERPATMTQSERTERPTPAEQSEVTEPPYQTEQEDVLWQTQQLL